MTVRVRAGTTVDELAAGWLRARPSPCCPGRALPWAACSSGAATSAAWAGPAGHGAGPLWVGGHGRGAGGPTVKNVSGFDLCRLMVGSLGTLGLLAEVVLRTRPAPAASRWVAGEVDPAALLRRLHRPSAVLWDGTTTWALLEGHPADVEDQARLSGLPDAPGPPPLPPHRWSVRPAEVFRLAAHGDIGPFVAEVGVGVVHASVPPPARPVDPAVVRLHERTKALFDPTNAPPGGRRWPAPLPLRGGLMRLG